MNFGRLDYRKIFWEENLSYTITRTDGEGYTLTITGTGDLYDYDFTI